MQRLLDVARGEVGYLEKASNSSLDSKTENAGYRNWTKYARDLDSLGDFYNGPKNGFEWCDIFVDWCMIRAYGVELGMKLLVQPKYSAGAGCTYSMGYYKSKGQLYSDPKPGDQIFFSNDNWKTSYHTGLVEKVEGEYVYTIEGNTSAASGVVANGGGVARKSYPVSWGRYGRPDWSLVEGYVNDEEDEEVTYEQFKNFMNQYLEEVAAQEPSNWSKRDREWAETAGVIQGDENGNKRYKSNITREELAAVMHRFSQLV